MRATDIVARLSGDEFAVLMPQTDTAGALQLGEDLRAQVAENAAPAPDAANVTISVGITMFGRKRGIGAEAVLVAADQAMYRAKEEGRNQIALFQDPDEPRRRPQPRPDDLGAYPRRAHPRSPQPPHPADPQPGLRAGSSATSCCCG